MLAQVLQNPRAPGSPENQCQQNPVHQVSTNRKQLLVMVPNILKGAGDLDLLEGSGFGLQVSRQGWCAVCVGGG